MFTISNNVPRSCIKSDKIGMYICVFSSVRLDENTARSDLVFEWFIEICFKSDLAPDVLLNLGISKLDSRLALGAVPVIQE